MARFVVGVSGASGIILALRILKALGELGHAIELVITKEALHTAAYELGKGFGTAAQLLKHLPNKVQEKITLHPIHDVGATISSGSFLTDGMFIIPCSMATLAAIATGLADNALRRAADVTIKEKRRLVIVPREAPLSEIHLENMLRLARLGAVILPPTPAWYLRPTTLEEVEEVIVARALDAMGVNHSLGKRWGEMSSAL